MEKEMLRMLLDTGTANDIIGGYAVIAAKYAGASEDLISKMEHTIYTALDMYNAEEAEQIWRDGLPEELR